MNRPYKRVRKVVFEFFDGLNVYAQRRDWNRELFEKFVQIFSDKPVSTMNNKALVTYPSTLFL